MQKIWNQVDHVSPIAAIEKCRKYLVEQKSVAEQFLNEGLLINNANFDQCG